MGKMANRAVICECLLEEAKNDQDICVVVSDSRGSASLTPFTKARFGWHQCRTCKCWEKALCGKSGKFSNNEKY